jgi:hypothetical protein
MNAGVTTNEFFNEMLEEKGEDHTFGAMQYAYWRSCKISNVKPMKIEWMQDFYNEMLEQERLEEQYGL